MFFQYWTRRSVLSSGVVSDIVLKALSGVVPPIADVVIKRGVVEDVAPTLIPSVTEGVVLEVVGGLVEQLLMSCSSEVLSTRSSQVLLMALS
jgi:hypothetical protein